jgi:hypothetical protein
MIYTRYVQFMFYIDFEYNSLRFYVSKVLTARLTRRSTHIYMKIIFVEDSRVLLGVFKHQHLYFCKRDLRTPARVYNVIMSAWIIVRSGTLDVDIRGVPFIEGFFISGD